MGIGDWMSKLSKGARGGLPAGATPEQKRALKDAKHPAGSTGKAEKKAALRRGSRDAGR